MLRAALGRPDPAAALPLTVAPPPASDPARAAAIAAASPQPRTAWLRQHRGGGFVSAASPPVVKRARPIATRRTLPVRCAQRQLQIVRRLGILPQRLPAQLALYDLVAGLVASGPGCPEL